MVFIRAIIVLFFLLSLSINISFSQDTTSLSIIDKGTGYYDVPNTNVKIIPPAHFIFMENSGGFMHIGTSSSIQVLEVKGTAYTMIITGLTAEYFKTQGVTLIEQEDVVTSSGKKAKLFTVAFKVQDVPFERLMFFTGDYNNTIWINANYPVAVKEMLNIVLKESLLSAQFKQ